MKWHPLPLVTLLIAFATGLPGLAQSKKSIKSLRDIDVLAAAEGTWEGVGIGFDIVKGELEPPVSFRDDWTSSFKDGNLTYEMTGLVKRGGIELPYAWTFDFKGDRNKITASYEMATDQRGKLGVKIIADGQRIQLSPIVGEKGINMTIDIYFEDDDLVIESRIKNLKGELVYQSATRYQKVDPK